MLKTTVNEFEFQTLNPEVQKEYKKETDGTYKLDLGNVYVTDKDPAGLMSALEKEREQNRGVKEKLDALEKERDEAKAKGELDAAKTKDEITALFKQQMEEQQKKYEERLEAEKKALAQQQERLAKQHLQAKASEIANELAGDNAALMLPHIESRMKAIPGDEPAIEFIDDGGQANPALNLESFKKSFLTKDHFKPILVGTKASGGSASGGTTSGVPTMKADGSAKGFNDYSSGELAKILEETPDEYQRLKAARVEE